MRVFIAINFMPEVKAHLSETIQDLRKEAISGNFTRSENIHLTLAFLGEVAAEQTVELMEVMHQAAEGRHPFELEISGFGKFINHGESIYWRGIRENEGLIGLQREIISGLKKRGFAVDDRPFKPHITLGRRCIMQPEFEEEAFAQKIESTAMQVTTIHLVKSEQKEGQLVYSSLGEVKLQESK